MHSLFRAHLALLFCVILCSLRCSLERVEPVVVTYRHIIESDALFGAALKIYQRTDGSYFLFLRDANGTGGTIILDREGNLTAPWLPFSSTYQLGEAAADGADGFIVTGTNNAALGGPITAFVGNVSPTRVLTIKDFSFENNSNATNFGYGIALCMNREVAVCGLYNPNNGAGRVGFAKFDASLNLKVSKGDEINGYTGWSVAQRPTGEYLVTASTALFNVNASGTDILDPLPLSFVGIFRIEYISGDSYALYNDNGSRLARINASGSLNWDSTYAGIRIREVEPTTDGNIIACGQKDDQAFLAKISFADGKIIWSKRFKESSSTSSAATSIDETNDGGFVIGGSCVEGGKKQLYVVKTDANGNMP